MQIRTIEAELLPKVRKRLIQFLKLHGDKRITLHGIRWLKKISAERLSTEKGTLIIAALDNKKLVGILNISDYGRDESYVAVHHQYRQSGIAKQLIAHMLSHTEKAYGRVALDNIPSLKTCLAMGMVAFKLVTGPTGKPTMWFGVGNWTREDVK